jgi:hypothetical protein
LLDCVLEQPIAVSQKALATRQCLFLSHWL